MMWSRPYYIKTGRVVNPLATRMLTVCGPGEVQGMRWLHQAIPTNPQMEECADWVVGNPPPPPNAIAPQSVDTIHEMGIAL